MNLFVPQSNRNFHITFVLYHLPTTLTSPIPATSPQLAAPSLAHSGTESAPRPTRRMQHPTQTPRQPDPPLVATFLRHSSCSPRAASSDVLASGPRIMVLAQSRTAGATGLVWARNQDLAGVAVSVVAFIWRS